MRVSFNPLYQYSDNGCNAKADEIAFNVYSNNNKWIAYDVMGSDNKVKCMSFVDTDYKIDVAGKSIGILVKEWNDKESK